MAKTKRSSQKQAAAYEHDGDAVLRPEIGTQAQFKKKKPPKAYRYDSSLSPALDWDEQNPARELGEWLLAQVEEAAQLDPPHFFSEPRSFNGVEVAGLADAVERLKALGEPFLDWAGKAERLSFDVPTLPLFVHERLSTKAILETLGGHERDRQTELQLFADPQLPLHQQLEAYEHRGGWVNRMILGDSLVVMNSLIEYEGMGGQVQAIYIDPPYGVKFGSNFQPFVRKRGVKNNDDADMTREPEMVQAYRDTWELGLHSYLTYLRDRLLVAKDLLTQTGSVFVQINDERVHVVRDLLDEVFGAENFVSQIVFQTTQGFETSTIATLGDFILWYARDRDRVKVRKVYEEQEIELGAGNARWVLLPDGSYRGVNAAEKRGEEPLPDGAQLYKPGDLQGQGAAASPQPFEYDGKEYSPGPNSHWKANYPEGMKRLAEAGRIHVAKNSLQYRRFATDFSFSHVGNIWRDTSTGSFTDDKIYAVQTPTKAIERVLLLSTDPGDLVLDPTCGSGTTAYIAERWGRRWITVDTSRVPLALARQRLLTSTFQYYELQDPARGPAAGFGYGRKTNKNGVEVGGLVPHITLGSIASDEPPIEEVLVDRPETDNAITRVSGPFVVEATIPTPVDFDADGIEDSGVPQDASFFDRMIEALQRNPSLQLGENKTISLANVRQPAQTLTLSAEAELEPNNEPVAVVFGPENGAVSEKLVYEAAGEAHMKRYQQLLVIGFAIEPNARALVEKVESQVGIPTTYVQATPDLVMGDLLKTMRSSQLFSVSGLPDVALRKVKPEEKGGAQRFEVELRGLDTFDPATSDATHRDGDDVPAWLLDTAWNGLSFHVSQAFFPRTSAWENLKKALKTDFEESVWDHLSGTVSAPFTAGDTNEIAVKVIDDRGNELLVIKSLDEAK